MKRLAVLLLISGCAKPDRVLTIIGTSDLHGHVERLPLLGGYVRAVRAKRPVLLVDGGDLFQGTIVSNRAEGAPVVRAMNVLGYTASALGNHELDYGQQVLQQRAREAHFRFLDANVIDERTGAPANWPNISPRMIVEVGGIKVGITGGATKYTPTSASPRKQQGLRIEVLDHPIRIQAVALRHEGAEIVVVAVHAGGRCRDIEHPDDLSTCATDSEVFQLANSLPPGLVDVIVAGHTHNQLAQRVNGIAIIQSWLKGQGFGRVDLVVGKHKSVRIFPPRRMQPNDQYEGAAVAPDPAVAATFADDLRAADAERARPLGPAVDERLWPAYEAESPLGNLLADLMREAVPQADLALQNGGGLRSDIPAGPLTYGEVYELAPFDNRLALVTMRGSTLRALLADDYGGHLGAFLSVSGMRIKVACENGHAVIATPIDDAREYKVVTTDFLADGGDTFGRMVLPAPGTKVEILWDQPMIHDVAAQLLSHRKSLRLADVFDQAHPRVELPGPRPICH